MIAGSTKTRVASGKSAVSAPPAGSAEAHEGPLYVISVAADLAGMHPQTLRQYDRLGLVIPLRTRGRGRRYTQDDIHRLREIQRLSQEEGINLAGIQRIIELSDQVRRLKDELSGLHGQIRGSQVRPHRVFTADSQGRINARSPRVFTHTWTQQVRRLQISGTQTTSVSRET